MAAEEQYILKSQPNVKGQVFDLNPYVPAGYRGVWFVTHLGPLRLRKRLWPQRVLNALVRKTKSNFSNK